ncbi:MAG TPA: sigma-70 family RNA polymerase sigma factor [Acidimicrobiales bacterium]|nr:sigma-70 family RNA polymerase sigma factor [Acidimicrobiales bacterium]
MTALLLDDDRTQAEARVYEDHAELWDRYLSDRSVEARNALVVTYRTLVLTVVKSLPRNVRSYWDDDDLVSFGTFGLMDAIARWEPSARFETYATTRIRGAIYDELRRLDWLPRRIRRHVVAYNQASDELFSRLGRTPGTGEVLHEAGLHDQKERLEALDALLSAQLLHIDQGMVYGAGDEVIELVSADDSDDPESKAVLSCRLGELRTAVTRLPAQQREVVSLHLLAGLTQLQVASLLKVSESRVCQIAKAGTRALRLIMCEGDALDG